MSKVDYSAMTSAAKSIYLYSFYLLGMGLVLLLIPNSVLPLLGFETTNQSWIHILGIFTLANFVYYLLSARHNQIGSFVQPSMEGFSFLS